jgi:beta-fructofuranosidase
MWECPDFFPVGNKWLFYVSTENKVRYWLGDWRNREFKPSSEGVLVHGSGYAPKSYEAPGKRRLIWAWLREQRSGDDQLKAGWSGAMSLAVVPSLAKDGTLLLDPAPEYRRHLSRRVKGEAPPPDRCEIRVRLKPDKPFSLFRGQRELIGWDPASRTLSAGRSESPAPGPAPELRVFLDGSVVEVFADRRTWLTGRVYGPIDTIRMSGEAKSLESWSPA